MKTYYLLLALAAGLAAIAMSQRQEIADEPEQQRLRAPETGSQVEAEALFI